MKVNIFDKYKEKSNNDMLNLNLISSPRKINKQINNYFLNFLLTKAHHPAKIFYKPKGSTNFIEIIQIFSFFRLMHFCQY